MTKDRKAESNRQNALKSTGPKTPKGKAAIRHNALKHGLLSKDLLLPGEDEEALSELSERLRTELQPAGDLENILVDRIIATMWRLRRLERVEAGMFAWEHYEELAERAEREARSYEVRSDEYYANSGFDEESLKDLLKNMSKMGVTDEKKHKEAISRARQLRGAQEEGAAALGRTFVRDAESANALSKLSRYETAIERSLYKALHELERLQRDRSAPGSVPPPLSVDVDVSGLPEADR